MWSEDPNGGVEEAKIESIRLNIESTVEHLGCVVSIWLHIPVLVASWLFSILFLLP